VTNVFNNYRKLGNVLKAPGTVENCPYEREVDNFEGVMSTEGVAKARRGFDTRSLSCY
jgi:hypothetical protein